MVLRTPSDITQVDLTSRDGKAFPVECGSKPVSEDQCLLVYRSSSSVQDAEDSEDLVVKTARVEFKMFNVPTTKTSPSSKSSIGETDGSKWAILKLPFRFYDVTGGPIKIDDHDIATSGGLERIAVVPAREDDPLVAVVVNKLVEVGVLVLDVFVGV